MDDQHSATAPRTRRRRLGVLAAGLAVLVTAGVAALLAANPAVSTPAPPPGLEFGVHDPSTGAHLSLQADPGSDDYGAFTIATPGLGVVWARGKPALSGASPVLQLRYEGDAFLDKDASIDDETGSDYVLSGASAAVALRVVGQVNTATHEATVNYWVDGVRHQLHSRGPSGTGSPAAAQAVARTYLSALEAHDAGAVYDVMDWQTHASVDRDRFIATTSGSPDFQGVSAARITGTPVIASNAGGVTYATVPVSVTSRGDATGGQLTLVWHRGAWQVYGVR